MGDFVKTNKNTKKTNKSQQTTVGKKNPRTFCEPKKRVLYGEKISSRMHTVQEKKFPGA